jgi:DNA replication protein DnaC
MITSKISNTSSAGSDQVRARMTQHEQVPAPDAWAEIFGDAVAVAAMVDRLVHHAEIINLKGESYRLKGRRKEVDHSN